MSNFNKLVEDCIFDNPLPLLSIKDPKIISIVDSYLPYSTGIELECHKSDSFNEMNFRRIPNIMDVSCDAYEQRFRIPPGVEGLICLYQISEQLKLNSLLNMDSGNHYHIDFLDCLGCWNKIVDTDFRMTNDDWIIKELESWNYKGTYNTKGFYLGSWVRPNSLGTLEFRIGEMTFDYRVLVRRITHCQSISRKIKEEILGMEPKKRFYPFNALPIIEYIKSSSPIKQMEARLEKLATPEPTEIVEPVLKPDYKEIIKNRTKKI